MKLNVWTKYPFWASGEGYIEPKVDYYEQRYREWIVKSREKKAQALGIELVARPSVKVFKQPNL